MEEQGHTVEQEEQARPAIYGSKYLNLIVVMESGEEATRDYPGKKGRRIEFVNGKYETYDEEEIVFLNKLSRHKTQFRDIEMLQRPYFPGNNNKKGGKK